MGVFAWVVLAWFSQSPAAGAADEPVEPTLQNVELDRDDEGIYVSLRVQDGLTPAVREQLRAGVPVAFQYTVKVCRHRRLWFPETVVSRHVETRAKLDVLSREYHLSRSMDGHVLDARDTQNATDAVDHLSRLARVKIAPETVLDRTLPYQFLARAKVQDAFVLYVIPWAVETPWYRQTLEAPAGHH